MDYSSVQYWLTDTLTSIGVLCGVALTICLILNFCMGMIYIFANLFIETVRIISIFISGKQKKEGTVE